MLSSVDEINIIRRESVVNVRRSILVTWALLAAILFGLLVLSITIPKFGSQYISLNCQSVNPNSGIPLISAYYHLFRGFGSSTDCSNENGNFCISWSDTALWNRFIALSDSDSKNHSSNLWLSAQVLSILSCSYSLLALIVFIVSMNNIKKPPVSLGISICGGMITVLCGIFSLSAINCAAGSIAASPTAWKKFYQNGHTLKELIEPLPTTDPTTTTINTNNNLCTVNVTYEDGGGLLSAAVGLSFTLSAAMVIANYCGLFLCHTNIDGKSHLAFWFCAQHNHHDNDDDEETKNDATEEVAVGKEESNKSESGEYAKGLERRNEYS